MKKKQKGKGDDRYEKKTVRRGVERERERGRRERKRTKTRGRKYALRSDTIHRLAAGWRRRCWI